MLMQESLSSLNILDRTTGIRQRIEHVESFPQSAPERQELAKLYNRLGTELSNRFEISGSRSDSDDAVVAFEKAVASTASENDLNYIGRVVGLKMAIFSRLKRWPGEDRKVLLDSAISDV